MRRIPCISYLLTATLLVSACAETDEPARIEYLQSVAAAGSAEPHLAGGGDIAVLSWLEPDDDGSALRYSVLDGNWGTPRTVARGRNWFVNWADFPSVVPIEDEFWAAHWLVRQPGGTYAYDIAISLSGDGGETWSVPITPHTDDTRTEHGFVSLFPWQDGVGALWLDGRNMAEGTGGDGEADGHGGMALRSALITAAGRIADPQVADELVCDCCQTDVAIGSSGPIAVYRDRSADEIRDIYVSRAIGGSWQSGAAVADDGWQIAGCPVNGPAISADGDDVVVAWFTAAAGQSRVRLARSRDGAASFDDPIDIDTKQPVGRVGVLLLADGDALVSWLRAVEDGRAQLRARRVAANGTAGRDVVVATTAAGRVSGFPQMVAHRDKVLFAWTDVADDQTTVRSARVDPGIFDAGQRSRTPELAQ